jgi:tetratricopeptide (TPR) repeat protein
MASRVSLFLSELKRRKVDRAAAVYAVIGLGAIEAANNIFPWLFIPTWVNQVVLWLALAGFPAALVGAWLAGTSSDGDHEDEELTSEGVAAESSGHWTLGRTLASLAVFSAILSGGWFVVGRDRGPGLVAERIVVAPFRNLTGVDSLDVVGDIAAHWLSDDLQRAGGVDVVPADVAIQASSFLSASGALGTRDRVRDLAQDVGAGIVITGTYVLERDSLRFRAEIIDAQARRRLAEIGPLSGSMNEPTEAIERLRQRVMGALAAQLQENLGDYPNDFRHAPSFQAYRAFLEANYHHFRSENPEAVADYTRAYQLDTSFLEPLAASIISHNNGGNFEAGDSVYVILEPRLEELTPYYQLHIRGERARRIGEREEQLRFLREELDLYPGSVAPYSVAWAERNSNHPRRAIELLSTMDPERGSMREFFSYWGVMTDCYHMLAEHEQELREAQRAEHLYPERLIQPLDRQAGALAALGRVREVNAILDRVETLPAFRSWTPGTVMFRAAMELRAHGHREAAMEIFDRALAWYADRPPEEADTQGRQYDVAQIHYGAEHWQEARRIAEEMVLADPSDLSYQGFLGLVAAHGGDREEALHRAAWLAESRPRFFPSTPLFWRALIASALGDSEDAMSLLQEAFDRGLNWGNWHPRYHSLEPLYDLPVYMELMRPKG